ncbi:MAG TPA: IS5 family transposase, partial [Terriglobales bacterium]
MVLVDGQGLPLGVWLESASPHEVTLAEATLAEVRVPRAQGRPRQKPKRVIADTAYDSDPLRQRLKKRGIELIAPYRENNQHRRYEDGRKLRRYKRRWIVERTNSWLGQFRRLLVRHEHLLSTYRAFFYLACFWITLRHWVHQNHAGDLCGIPGLVGAGNQSSIRMRHQDPRPGHTGAVKQRMQF